MGPEHVQDGIGLEETLGWQYRVSIVILDNIRCECHLPFDLLLPLTIASTRTAAGPSSSTAPVRPASPWWARPARTAPVSHIARPSVPATNALPSPSGLVHNLSGSSPRAVLATTAKEGGLGGVCGKELWALSEMTGCREGIRGSLHTEVQ